MMFDLATAETLTESIRNEDGSGILVVDKPTGMSSHAVVAIARKKLGIKKIGHAGTLDPLATGLLILLVTRQYTKLQPLFLKQDKEYLCTAQLGIITDSFDSDGNVVTKTSWSELKDIEEKDILAVLEKFKGEQQQTVPSYSAVKIKGQKLYTLARKNEKTNQDLFENIELPVRTVQIKELELESFEKNELSQQLFITFRTFVSSGTYIRSLAHDIGQQLGVGATVTALRRTRVGQLDVKKAITLEQI